MLKYEEKLKEEAEEAGYEVIKRGWPDLTLVKGGKLIMMVEVKGGYYGLQKNQKKCLEILHGLGADVRISLDGKMENLLTLEEYLKRKEKKNRIYNSIEKFEKEELN